MKSIDEVWVALATTSLTGGDFAARPLGGTTASRLFAGVDAGGGRHILVALNEGEADFNDIRSRGISASTEQKAFSLEAPRRFVDITCMDVASVTILDVLAAELHRELSKSGTDAGILVRSIFAHWRRFWSAAPAMTLTVPQQAGLFAELWFLRHWMFPAAGIKAVTRWRGPRGSRHDFEWPGRSIEAKSTLVQNGRIHTINGFSQLEPPENGDLYLFSQRLREEGGATNSLTSLIKAIRADLVHDAITSDIFDSLILESGFHDAHASEYEPHTFRVVDELLYEVGAGFPKLTSDCFLNGIPTGVESIQYDLNLVGFESYVAARSPIQAVVLLV